MLLEFAHQRKLQWFGHTTRRPSSLAHDVIHGLVEDCEEAKTKMAHRHGRMDMDWDYNMFERGQGQAKLEEDS